MDGWNAFDTIVVALSLVALGPIAMPINVLSSLRAFHLFGRMAALRDIMASVPVLNACLVMLIVASKFNPSARGKLIEAE